MGGLLFIFGSIIATAVGYALYRFFGTTDFVSTFSNREALRLLSCMIFCLLFGVIGFIDDFAKVAKKQNEGLKPMQKIVLQVVAAVLWLAASTGWAIGTPTLIWALSGLTSRGSTIR